MKVFFVVMMVAVAAVCAFPAEQIADENEGIIVAVEAEPNEGGVQFVDGLVREKRQFGGNVESLCGKSFV